MSLAKEITSNFRLGGKNMSNMTGLGRYQKALELEAEGLEANQIAYKAGNKNTQAWHAAKHYYKKTDRRDEPAR